MNTLVPMASPGDGGEDGGDSQVRPKGGGAEAHPRGHAPAAQDAHLEGGATGWGQGHRRCLYVCIMYTYIIYIYDIHIIYIIYIYIIYIYYIYMCVYIWLVVWNMFYFSRYWRCHHPN